MNEAISEMLKKVSSENLKKHLYYIAKDPLPFRKVNYTVPGHSKNTLDEADDFLQARLEEYGYTVEKEELKVKAFSRDESKPKSHQYSFPPAESPWHTAYNIYARKKGVEFPEKIMVVISHKDSQSWVDSPAAYDNATGTVASLEISRVLQDYRARHSIWFVFCNEEHVPWTSVAAAERAKARGDNITTVFNIDTIGGKSQADIDAGNKTSAVLYTTEPDGKRLAEIVTKANTDYGIGLKHTEYKRQAPGDDVGSFVKAGYTAAIALFGSYPYADPEYHKEGDSADRVDIENVFLATKLALAGILEIDSIE